MQTAPETIGNAPETATKEKSGFPDTFIQTKKAEESTDELSEVAGRVFKHLLGNTTSEESMPFESRIPVLTNKTNSVSPRKHPLPITQRPPFQSPAAEDTTRKGRRMLGTDTPRRRLSWSAGSSAMSIKTGGTGPGDWEDPTTSRGRSVFRGHFASRKSPVQEISAAKVQKWLGRDENRELKWPPGEQNQEEEWLGQDDNTSALLYPNPLLIREGGGPFDAISGGQANFSGNFVDFYCSETVCIKSRAAVLPKEDQDKGGWFLLGLYLPAQCGLEATVDLDVSRQEDTENACAWAQKFACIDNDGHQTQFQGALQTTLYLGEPLAAMKILIFEPIRTLSSTDFEIDSETWAEIESSDVDKAANDSVDEVGTLTLKYTMLCSLRMRPVLFYTDFLKFTIYLSGGPLGGTSTIELELAPDIDNRGAPPGHEIGDLQVLHFGRVVTSGVENETPTAITLTAAFLDFSTPFCIVFDKALQLPSHDARQPRISATAFRGDLPYAPSRHMIDWEKAARLPAAAEEVRGASDLHKDASPTIRGLRHSLSAVVVEQVPQHAAGPRWELLWLFLLVLWWTLRMADGWGFL